MRALLIAFIVSAAVSAALSLTIGPQEFMKIVYMTPQGFVLIGRSLLAYWLVYPATGSELAAVFAAILFNNTVSLTVVLSAPAVIHLANSRGRRSGGRLRRSWLLRRCGWSCCRKAIAAIAIMYITVLGLSLSAAVLLWGPSLFMPLESAYVAIASITVYRSSHLQEEVFGVLYPKMVKKALPAIAILLISSALVEAYEIL
ncbi:MAG: hypothetical protein QXJ55_09325 [Candidatus Caldarchaeum sp.]